MLVRNICEVKLAISLSGRGEPIFGVFGVNYRRLQCGEDIRSKPLTHPYKMLMMRPRTYGFTMKITLLITAILALAACQDQTQNRGQLTKALGESARPVIFQGEGSGPLPNYDERALSTFLNRLRVNADNFGVTNQNGNPVPPRPPFFFSPSAAEAGRWQGKHALEFSCNCPQADPPIASAYNTCCDIGFVDGIAQCVGPIVTCDSDQATEEADRWARLNNGDSSITNEPFGVSGSRNFAEVTQAVQNRAFGAASMFSPAVASIGIPPMNCVQDASSCGSGKCIDGETMEEGCTKGGDENPDCIGQCAGGPRGGESCIIPEALGEECLPENYPRQFYWTFGFGLYAGILPAINDGIHLSLAGAAQGDPPVLSFWSHFYDVAGPAQAFQLVHEGVCVDMPTEFVAPLPGMDSPLHGDTHRLDFAPNAFANGCMKYIFAATNADGFVYSYPSLGSLQARVVDGVFAPEDESCPVWTPTRVDTACLPNPSQCTNGDTRICYSGREGTQGKGSCEAGTETCERGRWNGSCTGEVLPETDDTCGDETDNNCNGFVDEGCPISIPVDDVGPSEPDMSVEKDMGGNTTTDMGGGTTTVLPDEFDEEGGCCATISKTNPKGAWLLPLLLVSLAFLRRKK